MFGNGDGMMGGGMLVGMSLASLAILVLVVFGIIALAKYIWGGKPRG